MHIALAPVSSRTTIQEGVYQQLRNALMAGSFDPGQTLTIASLAESFGTSNMPVREALAEGKLVRMLPDWHRDPLPLHIVYPPNRHLSNKVRVFVDWLAKLLVTSRVSEM